MLPSRLRRVLPVGIALLAVPIAARAGLGVWTTNGPKGANITALAIDPLASSHVFAGTNQAGIFQSTDSGQTWSFLALEGQSTSAIVFDPHDPSKILTTAVFALFRSLDGGRTWASDSQGLPAAPPGGYPPELSPPAFAPSETSVAYIGWLSFVPGPYGLFYAYGGVLRTRDGGATWTALGPVGGAVSSVATDPGDPSILYAVVIGSGRYRPRSIVKSVDGGATWTDLLAGRGFAGDYIDLVVDPHRAGLLYARKGPGSPAPSFLRSTDGGATWSPFASGLDDLGPSDLRVDPTNSDVLYSNTSVGLSRSDDAGVTWRTVLGSSLRALAISASDGRRLYGSIEDGVTTSGDGGATWQSSSSGIVTTRIPLLATNPGSPAHLYALVEDGRLYERRDSVSEWTLLWSFAGLPRSLTVDPTNSAWIWAGEPGCLGLVRSADGGRSFAQTSLAFGCIGPLAFEPGNPSVIYAPNSFASLTAGVLKSVDAGQTWTYADGGLLRDALVIDIDPVTPRTLYQGRAYEGVFKSTDAGATWSVSSDGLPADGSGAVRVQAIVVDPNTPATVYAALGTGGIFKSVDGGAHWSAANAGLGTGAVFALVADPTDPRRLYAATDNGVFVTPDGGASWSARNAGLTNLSIRSLVIDPFGRLLHAATQGGGVFDIEFVLERSPLNPPSRRRPQPRPLARP